LNNISRKECQEYECLLRKKGLTNEHLKIPGLSHVCRESGSLANSFYVDLSNKTYVSTNCLGKDYFAFSL
jgi:hypothetical protein